MTDMANSLATSCSRLFPPGTFAQLLASKVGNWPTLDAAVRPTNMTSKARDRLKTTYRQERALEVFYTGGPARVSAVGRLACACDGEVKVR